MSTWVTLCENKDFRTLYYRGKSQVHAGLVTYVRPNRLGYPRIGITTGKKVGCAVDRNHARRLVRAAAAELLAGFCGNYDIVVVCRKPIVQVKSTEVQQVLKGHLMRAGVLQA
jgi:ribonuclease P protein component